ncbi:MAG: hypothetical protein E6K80_11825 [Candidatus Eisenbacteria bacterium]|uniref:Glutamate/phenylalanine/leucine/valine/L-tryptophan dehydrogenase C-terminal domain-containing protein n=1 Tax=Eiseniibacteriota bacterium TaxID=2212470 RepID=A0A538U0H6_UNCEI|nr:MAG: hypothetical protein E6K80_11825 [Candidatus Eisenbacteria bacterium]
MAELPAGGGKAVILDHPGLRRRAAFAAFGRIVEGLSGCFHTGPDVGIRGEDLEAIGRETSHVARESDPRLGDIAQHTAMGVSHAMRACFELRGIAPRGARVVIQGAGHVGAWLARILAEVGCALRIADVDAGRARRTARAVGGVVVAAHDALFAECDVLAPCALGGVLDRRTIPRLRAGIVCGAANNQLADPGDGDRLLRRGVLYAPDYLANAGGVIRGAEYQLMGRARSWASLERIHDRMRDVARRARRRGESPARVADRLALRRASIISRDGRLAT